MLLLRLTCHSVCWLTLLLVVADADSAEWREHSHFRRPVAAVPLNQGRLLAVANRDSGSVSLLNTADWTVITERPVGRQLSHLAALADHLLAVDSQRHELLLLTWTPESIAVAARWPVPRYPVSIAVSPDERWLAVASLWLRRLTLFDVRTDGDPRSFELEQRADIALPFAPRLQGALPDNHLVVADAFGGRLAVVNSESAEVESVREIPGHNIRGLTLSPNGRDLFLAHQYLDERAPTTYDSIHWGNLIENLIRVVPVSALLDPTRDAVALGRAIQFGTTGSGAADPAAVAFVTEDRLIAVSSGVDRAQVFPQLHPIVSPSIATGRRPTAVAVLPQTQQAVVVNTLSDSLSVIDVQAGRLERHVSLGPSPEPGPIERGESLFFDARVSHDGWISCHSCHTDGHTSGLLADTMGDGNFGAPKRILSLLGTRDNTPWAWNGSLRTLHEQTAQSVSSSMIGELEPQQVNDLVTYLHTLEPPPPLRPTAESEADERLLERGRAVFTSQGCARCHVPPLTYSSDQIVDVGLTDELGGTKFNPPSLRGVSQQDRLFHDGRARSLTEVIENYGHQLPAGLDAADSKALIRYLQSL